MISIIIPVYNVSKSLHQCLNSVRKQTYKDWECILVNDASTDNSLQICSDFARKDKRFIVINKHVNEGCETARYFLDLEQKKHSNARSKAKNYI